MDDRQEPVRDAWAESLREVFVDVIKQLPSTVTLGELVEVTRQNPALAPVLDHYTVQELIDLVKDRPRSADPLGAAAAAAVAAAAAAKVSEPQFDEDGNPLLDLDAGSAVIRRRADAPDGDLRLLRALLRQKTGRREPELVQATGLASDQVRLILRNLRTRGYIHIEGTGVKRRVKITRHGAGYLRKLDPTAVIA
ncbi:hypothetical protein [Nannocystis bainbridge]|uniref:Uncharacterized protein n=1 Tax=Nannocystis bainbridge TaxID=2995303 RepID=A0ABT5E5N9_9BACT|nr:hypothetical protein [Nannocystis bainbridge]MDC0720725.1 hypothetical protein [Nannocystis bainbridge]